MSPAFSDDLVRRVANVATTYPYRTWGFGEDIALRGLLAVSDLLDEARWRTFVVELLGAWCDAREPLGPADHVAPGMVLLEAHEDTGDARFLEAALELAELLEGMPRRGGVILHRPDLSPWQETVWVDCMYMDGPFLLHLWRVTGDARWRTLALEHVLGYARALQDPQTGLFHHGYDAGRGERIGAVWGRGNGWALLGLLETLEALPNNDADRPQIRGIAARLAGALLPLQDASGAWPTVLTEPDAPLEPSTAALFAAGLQAALESDLIDADEAGGAIDRALVYLRGAIRADGSFPVSSATPIGDRETYTERELGVYPWGQGPALLAIAASRRAQSKEDRHAHR